MADRFQPLRLLTLWRTIGWLLLAYIIFITLTPQPPALPGRFTDKFFHFLGYFVLVGWFAQLYVSSAIRHRQALLFCGLGVTLEFTQLLVVERSFEWADMVANISGVVVAWATTRGRLARLLLVCERLLLTAR